MLRLAWPPEHIVVLLLIVAEGSGFTVIVTLPESVLLQSNVPEVSEMPVRV